MNQQTSLTAPADRTTMLNPRSNIARPELTEDELERASAALIINREFDFPSFERAYVDPPLAGQTFGLISFVPAKGATPNSDGIYGVAKVRGGFGVQQEAEDRAQVIIQKHDSYHHIHICLVGAPFPIVAEGFSSKVHKIDPKKSGDIISDDVKEKMEIEKKEFLESKIRQKQIETEAVTGEAPEDIYTTARIKEANLTWNYFQYLSRGAELRESLFKVRDQIAGLDILHPSFESMYKERYATECAKVGLKPDNETSFMRYIGVTADVGTRDQVLGYVEKGMSNIPNVPAIVMEETGLTQSKTVVTKPAP